MNTMKNIALFEQSKPLHEELCKDGRINNVIDENSTLYETKYFIFWFSLKNRVGFMKNYVQLKTLLPVIKYITSNEGLNIHIYHNIILLKTTLQLQVGKSETQKVKANGLQNITHHNSNAAENRQHHLYFIIFHIELCLEHICFSFNGFSYFTF